MYWYTDVSENFLFHLSVKKSKEMIQQDFL